MKYTLNSILLLITVTLFFFTYPTHSICIDFHDPMDLKNSSIVDCLPPKQNDETFNGDDNDNLQLDGSNLFQVNFYCETNDQVLCQKVEKTFNMAGDIVNYALVLHTPITIDVSFTPMDTSKLGGATPARYISLLDEEDQVERLYPQALVKQLSLPKAPATYSSSDITAKFNSLINWYIPGDNGPINNDQFDLLNTVLHEIVHGLGFVSSWRNHVDDTLSESATGLTPFILTDISNSDEVPESQLFKFFGFGETIFDKFILVRANGKQARLTRYSNRLNSFSGINQTFVLSDFSASLRNAPQYDAAQQILSFSTIKGSLVFMPKGSQSITNDGVILETGISPYQAGSSITHVDADIYNGDADFLMRRVNSRGVSMNSLIVKSGNLTGSAIGPKLLNILSSIGYDIADNPIKPSFAKSSASILDKQSIMIFIFQLTLSIIINQIL